jgi:hypothetical protein
LFATEEAAHLVALCAVVPYLKSGMVRQVSTQISGDFVLHSGNDSDKKVFTESFAVLNHFKSRFSVCFTRFLDLLEPEFIFQHRQELISFVLSVSPKDHTI